MIDLVIPRDGWLCVWKSGYEPNVKLIESREEACGYFTEAVGFTEEDIKEILSMTNHDEWSGDPNGLVIYKMNNIESRNAYADLKNMLGEMSEAIDDYGPEEITLFTYEHGYYSALSELGKTIEDDEYDTTRLAQVEELFTEYENNKYRR